MSECGGWSASGTRSSPVFAAGKNGSRNLFHYSCKKPAQTVENAFEPIKNNESRFSHLEL